MFEFVERSAEDAERLRRSARALPADAVAAAAQIIEEVSRRGDDAVRQFTRQFDGVELPPGPLVVPEGAAERAWNHLPQTLREDLTVAHDRVLTHQRRLAERSPTAPSWHEDGFRLGEIEVPIGACGIYVPGGTAPLFSSVLMTALPAKAAGVEMVAVASPPSPSGLPHPTILAACHVCEVTRIHPVGGAQAIASFAFGTASIPAVDLIAGPGNRFVTAAKQLVFGHVGIDLPAGPSEILVVADSSADPEAVAADLLAQAEHDPDAWAMLIATDRDVANRTARALVRRLGTLPRREIAGRALAAHGGYVVVANLEAALDLADRLAPEHLSLAIRDPQAALPSIRRAGAVFLGAMPEALGDYLAGPSHVLPTAGAARYASPVSPATFRRRLSVLEVTAEGLKNVSGPAARLARAEGLAGHAEAVEVRTVGDEQDLLPGHEA